MENIEKIEKVEDIEKVENMEIVEEIHSEVQFIDIIKDMQKEVENPETQFIEIFLPMDNHIVKKDDEIIMTEEGFISINKKNMFNLSFVAGASLVEVVEEEENSEIMPNYG